MLSSSNGQREVTKSRDGKWSSVSTTEDGNKNSTIKACSDSQYSVDFLGPHRCPTKCVLSDAKSVSDLSFLQLVSSSNQSINSIVSAHILDIGDTFHATDADSSPGVASLVFPFMLKQSGSIKKCPHNLPIDLIKMGHRRDPWMIVTSSKDKVCVWYYYNDPSNTDSPEQCLHDYLCLAEDLGKAQHVTISQDDRLVAVCVENQAYVFDHIQKSTVILEGHSSRITSATFFQSKLRGKHSLNIITTSEDRTFKIWDILRGVCLYQSAIISSHPITALDMDPRYHRHRFCIGSDDGHVRFYDYSTVMTSLLEIEPRQLTLFDVAFYRRGIEPAKEEPTTSLKVISSQPLWKMANRLNLYGAEKDAATTNLVHLSDSIVALKYEYFGQTEQVDDDERDDEGSFMSTSLRLLIGCPQHVTLLDVDTYSAVYHVNFCTALSLGLTKSIPFARQYEFCASSWDQTVHILISNHINNEIFALKLSHCSERENNRFVRCTSPLPEESLCHYLERIVTSQIQGKWAQKVYRDCLMELHKLGLHDLDEIRRGFQIGDEKDSKLPLFVLDCLQKLRKECHLNSLLCLRETSETKLLPKSPLKHAQKASAASNNTQKHPKPNSKPSSNDKPLTFRSKVKSSGYSQAPKVLTMFTRPSQKINKKNEKTNSVEGIPCYFDALPNSLVDEIPIYRHSGAVLCLKYHPSGTHIASSSADKNSRLYKLNSHYYSAKSPVVKDFIGHDSPVEQIVMTEKQVKGLGYLIMTTSHDGLSRMWSSELSEPLLILGAPVSSASSKNTTNKRYHSTTFFYHDSFLMSITGSILEMHSFSVQKPDPSIIQPALRGLYNKTKVIASAQLPVNQAGYSPSLTSMGCLNTAYSHLVICAGSDKSLHIWNVNEGKWVACISQSMKRNIHTIALADYYSCGGQSDLNGSQPSEGGLGLGMGYGFENIFATAALTDSIKLWDIRSVKPVLQLHGHINRLCKVGVSLSPCGRYVLSGSEDNQAYLYDIRKAQVVSRLAGGHSEIVSAVDFNPMRPEIATGGYDGKIRFWK